MKVQQGFKLKKLLNFCGHFVLLINWLQSLYGKTSSGFTTNMSFKYMYKLSTFL